MYDNAVYFQDKCRNTKGKLAEIKVTVLCVGSDRNVLRALEVNVNELFVGRQGQGGETI